MIARAEARGEDRPRECGASSRTLFRGAAVAVHDSACAARTAACGADLAGLSVGHRVVFTRGGAFVPERGAWGERTPSVVGDPTLVLVANAGEPLDVRHAAAAGHACTTFTFAAETIARPFSRAAVTVPPSVLLEYHALRRALLAGCHAHVEARAVALLQGVLAAAELPERVPDDAGGRRREIAAAARETLVRAPGRAHHLADVARALGISASHLAHVFRDEVGVPLHRYLVHLRLALALERLGDRGEEGQLSALALDLGFATHSHFSAAFRRWYGASPAAVRRRLASA